MPDQANLAPTTTVPWCDSLRINVAAVAARAAHNDKNSIALSIHTHVHSVSVPRRWRVVHEVPG